MAEDKCLYYTLSDVVNQYMIRRGNMKRKFMVEYLSIFGDEWINVFKNTLFVVQNKWLQVKSTGQANEFYVDVPKDSEKFWGLFEVDECGDYTMLYYNQKMAVLPQPISNGCGCNQCECDGLCGEINNFTVTTNPIVIGGNTYYEKIYMKLCDNGTIYEYKETPTAKFTQKVQAGDYNSDYNNDYLVDGGFQNFQVVTHISTRLVCQLQILPCGCPAQTPENEEIFFGACGCQVGCWNHKKHCDRFMDQINKDCRAEISFSNNGRRVIIRQNPHTPKPFRLGDFVLMRYQTNGTNPGSEIIIPEFARKRMWAGGHYEFVRFKDRYTLNEKEAARIQVVKEDDDLFLNLNRFQMKVLAQTQDARIEY